MYVRIIRLWFVPCSLIVIVSLRDCNRARTMLPSPEKQLGILRKSIIEYFCSARHAVCCAVVTSNGLLACTRVPDPRTSQQVVDHRMQENAERRASTHPNSSISSSSGSTSVKIAFPNSFRSSWIMPSKKACLLIKPSRLSHREVSPSIVATK